MTPSSAEDRCLYCPLDLFFRKKKKKEEEEKEDEEEEKEEEEEEGPFPQNIIHFVSFSY